MKAVNLLAALMLALSVIGQEIPKATSAEERKNGFEKRKQITGNHVLKNVEAVSVGPTIMGGRVSDVDVNPSNPNEFYIAYASGGLFHTSNNGQSYKAIFDNEMVISIGDIAVDWNNNTIWIGSGENNSSRSSYSGFGIYKSTDGGESWQHMGLEESHHIGRIILHPENKDVLWVAALGHLYSSNEERGVYKTTDGGKTWKKVLYVDENTGAIDMVIHPTNPDEIYAAMWHRQRRAWNFVEAGKQSGIFRSTDGGENWKIITGEGSGFAFGDGIGRIGLAISKDGKYLFAVLDNQNPRPKKEDKKDGLTKDKLRNISEDDFLSLDKKDLDKYLKDNNFPKELSSDSIKSLVKSGELKPIHLVYYIEDSNRDLFDTEVTGAEVYVTNTAARSWSRTHEKFIDDLVFTYGYYFGQIRISPTDNSKIYITGVPILKSVDGGKTFESINGDNQHVDHHALWVNPNLDGHLINGNDGGINISYDDGENWMKVKSPPVGQFYTVSVDNDKPYNIYGGLQDNGVWYGPSNYKEGSRWEGVGNYPYKRILGGDGFHVEIDGRDNKTVYTGFQFGHYYRFNREGGPKKKVSPKHELGERPLRFNWQSPIYLSRHNQDVFYFGSNKFHRSLDKGESYDVVSKDMTKGGKKGNVSYGTLTCIHESPLKFGLIYIGTDDGLAYRSDDMGYNWTKISNSLPANMWVSSIQASRHDSSRLYVTLNGYRWDHFNPYVYVSEDYGNTWKNLGENLPMEPVNVIREDVENADILYVGTDHGLYVSLNRGESFNYINNGIPSVPVHDLAIQERERDLLIGTHGRSIYKFDISQIQKLTPSLMEKGIHLFKIPSVKYRENWGKQNNSWRDPDTPSVVLPIYIKNAGGYNIEVRSSGGILLFDARHDLDKGLNYVKYDLTFDETAFKKYTSELQKKKKGIKIEKAENGKFYLKPGEYTITVKDTAGKMKSDNKLVIKSNVKK